MYTVRLRAGGVAAGSRVGAGAGAEPVPAGVLRERADGARPLLQAGYQYGASASFGHHA